MSLQEIVKCPDCNGTGIALGLPDTERIQACVSCRGRGTLPQDVPREITEKRIKAIRLSDSMVYFPLDGEAKWFKDELGTVWCKFRETDHSSNPTIVLTIVLNNAHVTEVQYESK